MKILIVDDELPARTGTSRVLARAGFEVVEAPDGHDALQKVDAEQPDIVLLDVRIPRVDGMAVLERLQQRPAPPLVIMMTAYGSERLATEAIKKGAYDYIPKPYEIDELRAAVARAAETLSLRREAARLKAELDQARAYGELVGASEPMRRVFETIEKVSQTDVTVLIRGESGTGKEIVAREIHRRGARADAPFVAMNCAAMPETLVESELFGHEKGAFTGASAQRPGKFELADGGTLLLDEIGDMSPGTQAKVLRVLQNGEFERLGGRRTLRADVRLISSTHRDLQAEIRSGRFREDLYFRLRVVEIVLPPLRQRPEDIPLLAEHFLTLFSRRHDAPPRALAPEAMRKLVDAPWPGNVRQLRNVMESAVVLAGTDTIGPEDLSIDRMNPPAPASASGTGTLAADPRALAAACGDVPLREAKKRFTREFEAACIRRALEQTDGNISRAAERLGMKRQNLQKKMRELDLR
jgi:two-component system response regulator AtoC/two-component system nitrogen regulation response regulator NtrX